MFPAMLPGGCFVIEDLFLHYGPDSVRMRGNSPISPPQRLWELTERLMGAPQGPNEEKPCDRLATLIDRIEFIKRAAFIWKSEGRDDPLIKLREIEATIQGSTNPDAWDSLAAAMMRVGTPAMDERAEAAIRRALKLRPHGDRHHYRLSILLERRGEKRAAVEHARLAVKFGPNRHTGLSAHLARLVEAQGREDC
jgi:hypothetical protein